MVHQGIEHIGNGHDAPEQRNLLPLEPLRIARAVPALMVGQRNGAGRGQQLVVMATDDVGPDLRVLTQFHPRRSAAAWFNLGFLLDEAGRPGEAAPAFARAVELDARLDRAWYGLALVLIRLGRTDDAIAAPPASS